MAMATMLVTGGSRGIGAATVQAAALAGYDVCFSYVSDIEAATSVAKKVKARGRGVHVEHADVSNEQDVVNLFDQCVDQFGIPDVVVNNAGVLGTRGELADFTAERISRTVNVNVFGALLVMREAAKRMSLDRGGEGGSIVNVSSRASTLGSPFEYIDYAATKGAVDSATIGLAKELGAEGVRVNAVRPGLIDTGIHASGGEPGRIERVAPHIPQKRGGELSLIHI